jgi:hypothetical protein
MMIRRLRRSIPPWTYGEPDERALPQLWKAHGLERRAADLPESRLPGCRDLTLDTKGIAGRARRSPEPNIATADTGSSRRVADAAPALLGGTGVARLGAPNQSAGRDAWNARPAGSQEASPVTTPHRSAETAHVSAYQADDLNSADVTRALRGKRLQIHAICLTIGLAAALAIVLASLVEAVR